MNAELRERLGKAAYEARQRHLGSSTPRGPSWEELPEKDYKEAYRVEAEAVMLSFVELLVKKARSSDWCRG